MGSEIRAKVSLDNTGFLGGLQKSQNAVGRFSSKMKAAGAAIVAGLAIGKITQQLDKLVDRATEIRDRSAEIGVDVEDFQKLEFFLQQSSGSAEDLRRAFRNLSRNREIAFEGDAKRLESFERLGISAERLRSANISDLFADISRALRTTGDTESLVRPLTELLGTRATQLIPALKTDLEDLFAVAENSGILINEDEIKKFSALGDELLTLKRQVESLAVTVGTPVVEFLTGVVKQLQSASTILDKIVGDLDPPDLEELNEVVKNQNRAASPQDVTRSTDRVDRELLRIVQKTFGNLAPEENKEDVDLLRRALGDQLQSIELDDNGLIVSNKALADRIQRLVAQLSQDQILQAELSRATGGREVNDVVSDTFSSAEQAALAFARDLTPEKQQGQLDADIERGLTTPFAAFADRLNDVAVAANDRLGEVRQAADEGTLRNDSGEVQLAPVDLSEIEKKTADFVTSLGNAVTELQRIVEASPAAGRVLNPLIDQLTREQSRALDSLGEAQDANREINRISEADARQRFEDARARRESIGSPFKPGGVGEIVTERGVGGLADAAGNEINKFVENLRVAGSAFSGLEAAFANLFRDPEESGGDDAERQRTQDQAIAAFGRSLINAGESAEEAFTGLELKRAFDQLAANEKARRQTAETREQVNESRSRANLAPIEIEDAGEIDIRTNVDKPNIEIPDGEVNVQTKVDGEQTPIQDQSAESKNTIVNEGEQTPIQDQTAESRNTIVNEGEQAPLQDQSVESRNTIVNEGEQAPIQDQPDPTVKESLTVEPNPEVTTDSTARIGSVVGEARQALGEEPVTEDATDFDFERDPSNFTDLQKVGLLDRGFVNQSFIPTREEPTLVLAEKQVALIEKTNTLLAKINENKLQLLA